MIEFIIKYWVEFLFTILSSSLLASFNYLRKNYKTENQRQNERIDEVVKNQLEYEKVVRGMRALLRDRIIQCSNYHRKYGFCPTHELETIEGLYAEYLNMGGNGTVTAVVEEMRKLPRVERKE